MKTKTYTLQSVSEIIKGKFLVQNNTELLIENFFIDSRNFSQNQVGIFFAIAGERNNGHQYIKELYKKGARNFIVSENHSYYSTFLEANIILVKNTIEALQQLAKYHREQFDLPTIGITGSNGKTTVKEWLFDLLEENFNIVRSPKSYNSQVGVPLSVLNILPTNDLAIFEAGISKPNEMEKLERTIQPTIGIFTNIGAAHDEGFENLQQKIQEKLRLFKNVKTLIYCIDHQMVDAEVKKYFQGKNTILITWSEKQEADIYIKEKIDTPYGTRLLAVHNEIEYTVEIPFKDDASIENSIHCLATLFFLKIDPTIIAQKLKLLHPIAMRMELLQGNNNCLLINDAYSADFESLEIALNLLANQKAHKKKTVIISDLLQTGLDPIDLYKKVAGLLKSKNVNRVIGVGKNISVSSQLFESFETEFYPNTQSILQSFHQESFFNEVILIKGARVFNFEKITALLQQQAHETVLEVSMSAMVHNLNFYKSQLKNDCKIMAMVKALSYGSGTYEIANLLEYQHVDYLAVAYADEGVALRKHGITLPIMVMNPDSASYDVMINYKLEPEIYSFRTLEEFSIALKKSGLAEVFSVHVKFDTGMHRLGFNPDENDKLCKILNENKQLKVATVFSHLAASSEKKHSEFTNGQILLFSNLADFMEKSLGYTIIKHITNTGGITTNKASHFGMVRLGIGLYGIAANQMEEKNLIPVGTLKTIISQIRNIDKGETIGYNRNAILSRNSRIATLPIGYADGYDRKLGGGNGTVLINGKAAKTVGNICMDMCMVDVTDIVCHEKDEVIIFGKELPIDTMAKAMNTITYEVLTGISPRVKRVFLQE